MEVQGRRSEPPARSGGQEDAAVLTLSVFFPAHNEALNLERTVHNAFAALERLSLGEIEVVIIDDGSTDGTGKIADGLSSRDSRIRVVHHPVNKGYGAALKSGFNAARLDWVFYSDSDGQFDLSEVALLLPFTADFDAIIGYRTQRSDHAVRKVNTLILAVLVRAVFKLHVRDVDCAFKLVRRRCLEDIGPLSSDGAMISTELLVKLQRAGARVAEVGVSHYPRTAGKPSGANPKVIARALRELISLRRSLPPSRARAVDACHGAAATRDHHSSPPDLG